MTASRTDRPEPMPAIDFTGSAVMVVGDVMLDRYWFGDVSRISPEAPVPVVRVTRTEERLGGAANVALNAAALGCHTTLIGVVGDDEAGGRVEQMARERGIDARLARETDLPTTIKLRVIGRQQQLLRVDFEREPGERTLARKLDAVTEAMASADVMVLSDYGKGGLAQIAEIIRPARAAGKRVVIDPKGDDYSRYRGATVLTPNRAELREVVGRWRDEDDLTDRAQSLRASLEVDYLLLTRSEEGMSLYGPDHVFHVPAQAREVYDVSGAGDTVVAVVAAMLAVGRPIGQAVQLANRAGGIVVGKLGTASVSPDELFGH